MADEREVHAIVGVAVGAEHVLEDGEGVVCGAVGEGAG